MISYKTQKHENIYDILCDIDFIAQLGDVEKALKMTIRPENAYFKLHKHDFLSYLPREELHQLLIGTYGAYLILASLHHKVPQKPEFILSSDARGIQNI